MQGSAGRSTGATSCSLTAHSNFPERNFCHAVVLVSAASARENAANSVAIMANHFMRQILGGHGARRNLIGARTACPRGCRECSRGQAVQAVRASMENALTKGLVCF